MGKVPPKDIRRNEELIADYVKHTGGKFKFSTVQLVTKYKISTSRIYEILNSYKVLKRKKIAQ